MRLSLIVGFNLPLTYGQHMTFMRIVYIATKPVRWSRGNLRITVIVGLRVVLRA